MSHILIDLKKDKKELRPVWDMGFNTCHCELLLRKDLVSHIKMAKEIGFKYIRFHNVFSSMMEVYSLDENGVEVYNFEKLDKVYDNIIESGLLPFFEISFTP